MSSNFVAGKTYNRRHEIHGMYGGQWQGGISTPAQSPYIFLFTGESGLAYGYQDRFHEDGLFWYTGEGQRGDMQMIKGNLAILNHRENGKVIYLFEYIAKGIVRYISEATYIQHHSEWRPDIDQQWRKAIIFELALEPPQSNGLMPAEVELPRLSSITQLWTIPMEELRRRALQAPGQPGETSEVRQKVYQRSQAIRIYVLRRAAGRCEACGKDAPFTTKDGHPYLESHHINRLADGGPDEPCGVAALCPNCHREVHWGRDGAKINEQLRQYVRAIEGHDKSGLNN